MGYRSNPILLRLGQKSNWISNDYKKYDYKIEILKNTHIYTYLDAIFARISFKKRALFFSHLSVRRANSRYVLNLYIYEMNFLFHRRVKMRWGLRKFRFKNRYWWYTKFKSKKQYSRKKQNISKIFFVISKYVLPYVKYYHLVQLNKLRLRTTPSHFILSRFITLIVIKHNLLNTLTNITRLKPKFIFHKPALLSLVFSLKNYLLVVLRFINLINLVFKYQKLSKVITVPSTNRVNFLAVHTKKFIRLKRRRSKYKFKYYNKNKLKYKFRYCKNKLNKSKFVSKYILKNRLSAFTKFKYLRNSYNSNPRLSPIIQNKFWLVNRRESTYFYKYKRSLKTIIEASRRRNKRLFKILLRRLLLRRCKKGFELYSYIFRKRIISFKKYSKRSKRARRAKSRKHVRILITRYKLRKRRYRLKVISRIKRLVLFSKLHSSFFFSKKFRIKRRRKRLKRVCRRRRYRRRFKRLKCFRHFESFRRFRPFKRVMKFKRLNQFGKFRRRKGFYIARWLRFKGVRRQRRRKFARQVKRRKLRRFMRILRRKFKDKYKRYPTHPSKKLYTTFGNNIRHLPKPKEKLKEHVRRPTKRIKKTIKRYDKYFLKKKYKLKKRYKLTRKRSIYIKLVKRRKGRRTRKFRRKYCKSGTKIKLQSFSKKTRYIIKKSRIYKQPTYTYKSKIKFINIYRKGKSRIRIKKRKFRKKKLLLKAIRRILIRKYIRIPTLPGPEQFQAFWNLYHRPRKKKSTFDVKLKRPNIKWKRINKVPYRLLLKKKKYSVGRKLVNRKLKVKLRKAFKWHRLRRLKFKIKKFKRNKFYFKRRFHLRIAFKRLARKIKGTCRSIRYVLAVDKQELLAIKHKRKKRRKKLLAIQRNNRSLKEKKQRLAVIDKLGKRKKKLLGSQKPNRLYINKLRIKKRMLFIYFPKKMRKKRRNNISYAVGSYLSGSKRYFLFKSLGLLNLTTIKKLSILFKFKYFFSIFYKLIKQLWYRKIFDWMIKDITKMVGSRPIVNIIPITKSHYHPILFAKFIVFRLLYQYRLGEVIYPSLREIKRGRRLKGIMLICSGRFTRRPRATRRILKFGSISLPTFSANVLYGFDIARLRYGMCGIKIFMHEGKYKYKLNEKTAKKLKENAKG